MGNLRSLQKRIQLFGTIKYYQAELKRAPDTGPDSRPILNRNKSKKPEHKFDCL